MHNRELTEQEKRDIIRKYSGNVTMDGKPAKISGSKLRFGFVNGIEFSWITIRTVCENMYGKFHS